MKTSAASQLRERQSPFPVTLQPVDTRPDSNEAWASVLLIDPRPLTRECLARWLEAGSEGGRIIAVPSLGDAEDGPPCSETELIVFNIGSMDVAGNQVLETLNLLTRRFPGVPIVLFAEREEVTQVGAALRHGVRGYISPSLRPEVVVEALRLIRAGGTFIPASVVAQAIQQKQQVEASAPRETDKRFDEFTPRELEVLNRLKQGMSNKVIAYELDICDNTVKVHVKHIMRKLKATNRTQAALLASRLFNGEE